MLCNQNRGRSAAAGAASRGAGAWSLQPAVSVQTATKITEQGALRTEGDIDVDRALMSSTTRRYTRIPSSCIPSNAA